MQNTKKNAKGRKGKKNVHLQGCTITQPEPFELQLNKKKYATGPLCDGRALQLPYGKIKDY